jgi:hypothetical protein
VLNLSFCTVRYCLMSTKELYTTDLTYLFLLFSHHHHHHRHKRLYNRGKHPLGYRKVILSAFTEFRNVIQRKCTREAYDNPVSYQPW